MKVVMDNWKEFLFGVLKQLASEKLGTDEGITKEMIIIEQPPKPEFGDIGFPMFPYARVFRSAPPVIAGWVKELLDNKEQIKGGKEGLFYQKSSVEGPYVNIFLNRGKYGAAVVEDIKTQGETFGITSLFENQNVMVEFSCPNTNKPLHLGHLRNDAIGESIARISKVNGANVQKVNLINDRGIHICKSMLAYQKFGNGSTPEAEGVKSDHFVGNYYVLFNKKKQKHPQLEEEARKMLIEWENGNAEINKLWKQMNTWAIDGIKETYQKTGVSFDRVYYESETYLRGKKEVLKGLENGTFYKDEEGTVWVDLSEADLDKKVLLRKDGTSLYLTQDIGTAIARHDDWPFEKLIYVVASEQQYHFKVLFYVLDKLGFEWAKQLYHLSYGMVNLPEGKMKSREGTVVDADVLLEELTKMAEEEIRSKGREKEVGDVRATAEKVAIGALHYYLLNVTPNKDMIFKAEESISFTGNTGPYLQYVGARISSILRKYDKDESIYGRSKANPDRIGTVEEWDVIKKLSRYPLAVEEAGNNLNPSVVALYLYDLAKSFSRFYHENQVLLKEDPELTATRLELVHGVYRVLKNGLFLIDVPFLDTM